MKKSLLSEQDKKQIEGIQMIMKEDQLLPISRSNGNNNQDLKTKIELQASQQHLDKINPVKDKIVNVYNLDDQIPNHKTNKNVSFNKNVQVKNFKNDKEDESKQMNDHFMNKSIDLNESSICRTKNDYYTQGLIDEKGDDVFKEIDSKMNEDSDKTTKSKMWSTILKTKSNLELKMDIDERIFEELYSDQMNGDCTESGINTYDEFKIQLTNKFKPDVILGLYKRLTEKELSQTQDEASESNIEYSYVNDEKSQEEEMKCVVCLKSENDITSEDNILDFKFMSIKSCWHRVHISCEIEFQRSNPSLAKKCPNGCGGDLNFDDQITLDEFIKERQNKQSLVEQLK